ncbi:hypothetical protein [Bacillus cereus]|uniref:hypothetical protein n=1 Tax=Bacillus cereus TaxID=1396 RepID=UPI002AC023E0|nr:hypothetical protein [Bacillus cereus]MDZ4567249.1 hypothetical protein [Bacillus cereus]
MVNKVLDDLYKHSVNLIHEKQIELLQMNISLYLEMLEISLDNSDDAKKTNSRKKVEEQLNNICKELIRNGNSEKTYEILERILELYSEKKDYFHLEEVVHELASFIQMNDNNRSIARQNIHSILSKYFYKSKNISPSIIRMYRYYLYAVFNNQYFEEKDKISLVNQVIFDASWLFKLCEEDIKKVEEKEILASLLNYIVKWCVDNQNKNIYMSALEKIDEQRDLIGKKTYTKILLSNYIYLYYLVIFEQEISTIEKEMYKEKLVSGNKFFTKIYMDYQYDINIFSMYDELKKHLQSWERMSSKVKFMIMDSVIRNFFMCFAIVSEDDLDDMSKEFLNTNEIFSFFNVYLDGDKLNENFIGKFQEFISLFGISRYSGKEDWDEDIRVFTKKLLLKYWNLEMENLSDTIQQKDASYLEEVNTVLQEKVTDKLKQNKYLSVLAEDVNNKKSLSFTKKIFEYQFEYPVEFLYQEKEKNNYNDILNIFDRMLTRDILRKLSELGFLYERIKYDEKDKSLKVLGIVQDKQVSEGIQFDTMFTSIDSNSSMLYFESGSAKKKLLEWYETFNSVIHIEEKLWVALDSRNIEIDILKIDIQIRDYTEIEMQQELDKLRQEKNFYYVNIVNDIHVPVHKEEAKQFIMTKRKVIHIEIELLFGIGHSSPGIIFDVIYNN